jgi:hypothetical protein
MTDAATPADPAIRYLGDLSRLKLEPGDKFVLTVDSRMPDSQQAAIRDMWSRFAGEGVPLLILEPGFRLGTINGAETTPGG